MDYLFFTNTPAHVHLYRNAASRLRERGHQVLVLGRDYGCTAALLDYYDLPHRLYGQLGMGQLSLVRELPKHFTRIAWMSRQYDPDLVFGMGVYAAVAGAVSGAPAVIVVDSEPDGFDHAISRRLVDAMLTPHSFTKDLGSKQYRFHGFKECAYLHPAVFEPDPTVRAELGLEPDEQFVLLRFNAFGAHHDLNHSGIRPPARRELVQHLAEHATVFVSDEGGEMDLDALPARPFDLHPGRLHDALYAANLLVADTQTMVTEAALLGTPAVRSNSFVGASDMGNFRELEQADLIYNIREFDQVLETATDLLTADGVKARWRRKREAYLGDKVNLTELIVDVAENHGGVDGVDRLSPTTGAALS